MNLMELQTAMGSPSRVDTGDYPGGYNEQRIYERDGGTIYVYTENGIVRSRFRRQRTLAVRRPCRRLEPVLRPMTSGTRRCQRTASRSTTCSARSATARLSG